MIEVLYQRRGEKFPGNVALETDSEKKARLFCRDLSHFPDDTIHYAITHIDGRTLYDTRKDGLL